MRALAVLAVAAAGFTAFIPNVASAAELDVPREGCERGQVWNGYRCEWARPQFSEAPPVYRAPPVYESYAEYEEAPVYVAPRVYVAPPLYVAPIYRAPVVRYYAGPRYVGSHGHHRHHRWR
jgi:hypothetical protein